MSWDRGRATIDKLLTGGELQRVAPSAEVADRLLADARAHVALATKGVTVDDAHHAVDTAEASLRAAHQLLASDRLGPFV